MVSPDSSSNGNGKAVTLTVNGRPVAVPAGTTVLKAAKAAGVFIPTLCASDKLSPYGSCRMCLVSIEGARGLPASCTTPAADGMVVTTTTPEIDRLRRNVMELYLSDFGDLPPARSDGGRHPFLDIAAYVGLREVRYRGVKHDRPIDDSNPYFRFDPNLCIACGRCVRACDEIQGTFAIQLLSRGFDTTVVAGAGVSFAESNCVSCGACVKECPTGALDEKRLLQVGPPDSSVRTTCAYCGVGCQFEAQVRGGQVVSMKPIDDSPVNEGHACVKGRFAFDYVYAPDRLRTPLIRKDGQFVEATWDEAIDLIAATFKRILEQHGPDALAGISSSRGTNEENYLMQKFFRAAVGTNNIDNCARVCHSATVSGMMEVFGVGAATNGLEDIDRARLLMIVGANPTEGHPVTGARIKRAVRRGAKLIVIDPRRIELCKYADVHLQLRPGANVAVLNGLAHVILTEGLYDEAFIGQRTENFEAYRQTMLTYTPERVEEISGVPADLLRKAARLYATSGASMCCHGLGVSEHKYGSFGVMAMANLALLTGNVGRPGTGINPLRGQNNVQGSCDVGAMPHALTTYQKLQDPDVRAKFEAVYGRPILATPGLKIPEMYEATVAGKLKGLWIVGYDVLHTDPNTHFVRRALQQLDFLVVQDLFLNETAKLAHVVLPGASFLEKDGTFTNGERRIQRIRKAIPPVGQARADWEVICAISEAMGYPMQYSHPSEVMDEIARLTPSLAGVSYDRLEGDGIQWPAPHAGHPGTRVMHQEQFPRGKGKFSPADYLPPGEEPDEDYPFCLVTGRILHHYNSGTMTRRTRLTAWVDEDVVELHPDDAAELRIEDGEKVRLLSRRGEVTLTARHSDRVAPGQVFATFHFPELRLNELLSSSADVLSKCPEYKVSAVRVEKIGKASARRGREKALAAAD
ncbi:MAG: formate dehydrogenase subunit alpha [Candidatus Handelsmanbacteria bacterium RIFCSPLOWO2_12_FULL_64_10]|uniref:Formate dehydrogenase subunit alpha n=1 Tax=Handelsmanbacteria sp. (strain RIFCSPLOWO2_12_FULL_64_10) TaxID=1817868 RepID=A0A1F6C7U8_HANXR|nr:MAG: formate dehydrogenase subunit alpha [Candidatus Handelsmanbacteria bacterium RIFCSPLOWO2_12_FULL_64_10]